MDRTICVYGCHGSRSYFFQTTKAFLPDMLKNNSGHLVTISSAAALGGTTGTILIYLD